MSFQKYEQYGKIRSVEYMADAVADLAELPKSAMGSTCYVIENAITYMCNSKQEWIPQNKPADNSSNNNNTPVAPDGTVDMSNYMTKAEVTAAIALATSGMIKEEDLITINGESLVGEKDINVAQLIPDEEITSEAEMSDAIIAAMTIEEI